MAALYLHNAIFSPEIPQSPTPVVDIYPRHHRRNQSSLSSIAAAPSVRTSNDFSHPTEPLLHSDMSGSMAYADLLSRQPMHPNGPQPGWDLGLSLVSDSPTTRENKYVWEQSIKKRLQRLGLIKSVLEILMGVWATYNTARYFIAFTSYSSSSAQAASLTLGGCTTLSISLLGASALISCFSSSLISSRISDRLLHVIRSTLRYFASLFLLVPAIVAFVLVFVWRDASDLDLRFRGRCHLDIDVVWSGPGSRCELHPPSWGAWLAVSAVRLIFTLIALVTYHITSRAYAHTRRPSQVRKLPFKPLHSSKPSYSIGEPTTLNPEFQTMMCSSGTLASSSPVSFRLTEQPSSSTLTDHSRTWKSSITSGGPKSIHSSRSRGSLPNSSPTAHNSFDASPTASGEAVKFTPLGHPTVSADDPHSPASGQPSDEEVSAFADRFRTLVSNVSRDVGNGLETVPVAGYSGNHSPSSYSDPHATQMLTAEELEILFRSDEFGVQAISEDHVIVLGGYVRRMSTIESLGSREMGSVTSHRNTFMSGYSTSGHNSHPSMRADASPSEADLPGSANGSNVSSVATGGHGGVLSTTSASNSNGSEAFLEIDATFVASPIDISSSTQGQDSIV